jgi:hypothetical protein
MPQNSFFTHGWPARKPGECRPTSTGCPGCAECLPRGRSGRADVGLAGSSAAQWAQEAVQGRGAGRQQGIPKRGGQRQAVVALECPQEGGHDRSQKLAAEMVAGDPRALEDRQQFGPVAPGAPWRPAGGPGLTAQTADGGPSMTPGGAIVLVQDPPALALAREAIPLAQGLGILPPPSFGHRAPFPARSVTPVLRHRAQFR